MAVFQGAGVALVTPFDENLSIDYEALGRLIEMQIREQTDALIVCGSTGEPATMTREEKLSVIRFAVEITGGRIPVIAGSGGNNTSDVVAFSNEAMEAGADALLVVTPFYNKATQEGLYRHYKLLADTVPLPIIMYNVPSRTGCNLLPQTAVRLAKDCSNLVGVKEASGDISQVAKLSKLARQEGVDLAIYSGNDDQIVPVLALGGLGVISVLSNVAPRDTHDMVMAYLNGDRGKALDLQLHYLDLIDALFCEVNPIPVKAGLAMMGLIDGALRLPLTKIEEEHKAVLLRIFESYGLVSCGK